MKYIKVDINITKEELKPIIDKIKSLGLVDKIDFNGIKKGYIYIYRDVSNKVCNFIIQPYRHNPYTRNAENFGEEITIEEFLKL